MNNEEKLRELARHYEQFNLVARNNEFLISAADEIKELKAMLAHALKTKNFDPVEVASLLKRCE